MNDKQQSQYVFISNPISQSSFTPTLSSNNASTSYQIPSQQSSASSQYQHTEHSSMECDNTNTKESYDIRTTITNNGFTPICEAAKTLQGSIWKVFYNKQQCEAMIKITDKNLAKKRIGFNHRRGRYFPCNESIKQEINMLHILNQNESTPSGMIRLFKVFEDTFNTFVAMEYGGTDLLSLINKCHDALRHNKMSLNDWRITTKIIFKQMIQFVDWLHNDMNVCHLDLSLENILIKNVEWEYDTKKKIYRLLPTFNLKFIDFGVAEIFTEKVKKNEEYDEDDDDMDDEDAMTEEEYESDDDEDMESISFECSKFVGKVKYECPNIYNRDTFDARMADIWSIGVCWFMICIGYDPWQVPDGKKDDGYDLMVNQQRLKDVLAHWKRSDYIDDAAHHLFYRVFADYMYRADTQEILEHPWLKM